MLTINKKESHCPKSWLATLPVLLALHTGIAFIAQGKDSCGLTERAAPKHSAPIPWSEVGARAGADYHGDGLSVTATSNSARLRCVFQRLEGQATPEGLWLVSTVTNTAPERFRVTASSLGRAARSPGLSRPCNAPESNSRTFPGSSPSFPARAEDLPPAGRVSVDGQTVRFTRPGLTEEYSVSMDGVRQDFLVTQRPAGIGELQVRLAVSGARVEPAVGGAQLVLNGSGRKIAYSRLRATDATGRELLARLQITSAGDEVTNQSLLTSAPTSSQAPAPTLAAIVNDADAVYPVRIDPTFSDANWISISSYPGANGTVSAAVVDSSGNLYIGGSFTLVGDAFAIRIAKWNGSNWSALDSGMGGGNGINPPAVYALAVSGSDLYAGGNFTTAGGTYANYIGKWNGSNWSALDWGMNHPVLALVVSGSDLYAGGDFTTAGGSAANYIAKWNGSSWSALVSGMAGGNELNPPAVRALAVSGSDLYAGGNFTTAGDSSASSIAKWNGNSWSALDSGMGGGDGINPPAVYALAAAGSDLYAGGDFTTAGGSTANYIAKWNGNSWNALDSGMAGGNGFSPPAVRALAVSGSDLYAGGDFTTAGDGLAKSIAKWNGSSWSAVGPGMGSTDGSAAGVYVLAVSGSHLYAGGYFTTAADGLAKSIAKWNGSSWSALGAGWNDVVWALAVTGNDLYAAGGTLGNRIAKWNGSTWSTLGSGMNYAVWALAASGSDLYAGGDFTTAGGSPANRIAKWNGSSWSALDSGMNGRVLALAVWGSDLYAGGYFTTAGGSPANRIAKWNGSSWSALGPGMDGNVSALAVSSSDLYAGGTFTMAGGTNANDIAKWNGSSWSALDSGMNNSVWALAVSGSDLYAGGTFTTAGGSPANYIAKWNGSSWSALDSGMSGWVSALAVSGSDLYAGGYFSTAGGNAADRVAKWNGSNWSALGSGMNGRVYALAVSVSELYAGGTFTAAGGKVSVYTARAYLERPSLSILRSGGDVRLSWPKFYETFLLQQNPIAANPNTWTNANYSLTINGRTKSATIPSTAARQFFRLIGN